MKQQVKMKVTAQVIPIVVEKGPRFNIDKLAIRSGSKVIFINYSDILYCQADSNYTNIMTLSGKKYNVSKTLKTIEDRLRSSFFFRTHASYLINLAHMNQLDLSDHTIKLCNVSLPISRRRVQALQNYLSLR